MHSPHHQLNSEPMTPPPHAAPDDEGRCQVKVAAVVTGDGSASLSSLKKKPTSPPSSAGASDVPLVNKTTKLNDAPPDTLNPMQKIRRRTSRVAGKITADLSSSFANLDFDFANDGAGGCSGDVILPPGTSIAPRRSSHEVDPESPSLGGSGQDWGYGSISAGAEWGNGSQSWGHGSINAGGIGGFSGGGTGAGAARRQSGKMQRRQSRTKGEVLSNMATSLGIGAFDLERELGPNRGGGAAAGKTKPPPPSMAASGKQNPFRGQPFRCEDVQGKAHVLVHDDELWRDFKSELDRYGVKTGLGVKMVLLKFVSARIPGDEADTKAALEALWQRQKMEQHKSSGKMRGAISAPSLVGGGSGDRGGGGGFLGVRRRASNASAFGGGAQSASAASAYPQQNAPFNLGRMSFRSAQSTPAGPVNHGIGVSDAISVGGVHGASNGRVGGGGGGQGASNGGQGGANNGGLKINKFSGAGLGGMLADIPSMIAARTQQQQRGNGVVDDDASSTSGTSGQESRAGGSPTANTNTKGGKGNGAAFTPAMDNDMARAAAIVAAMNLDDLSCDDDDDSDDDDSSNELQSTGSYSRRSEASVPRTGSFALSGGGDDDDDTEAVDGGAEAVPCAYACGRLNDTGSGSGDGRGDAEEAGGVGGLSRPLRRSRAPRRQSFGTLTACSLGTMSVGEITIDEDLFEDLDSDSSSDEEEASDNDEQGSGGGRNRRHRSADDNDGGSGGKGDNDAGDWNVRRQSQIECISVAALSQFGDQLSDYGDKTEVGNTSNSSEKSWGMLSDDCGGDETMEDDSSGVCQYECGRGYLSGDEGGNTKSYIPGDSEGAAGRGYIDGKGNINNTDKKAQQQKCNEGACAASQDMGGEASPPPRHRPESDQKKISAKQDINKTYFSGEETSQTDDDDNCSLNEDFILSFPSPEKRAEMRDLLSCRLDDVALDDDDDDEEADLPFSTFEEREMIRMMGNLSCPINNKRGGEGDRRGGDEEGRDAGANDASSSTWTCEIFQDSLRAETAVVEHRRPARRTRNSNRPRARGGGDGGEGNWVGKLFQRKMQHKRAEAAGAATEANKELDIREER